MAYSKVSTTASEYLVQDLGYSAEKKEIITYGLEKLLFSSLGFLVIIVMGWLLGVGREVIAAAVAGALLRKYSGGFHRPTALGCLIYGAVTYPAAAWLAHYIFAWRGGTSWLPIGILGLVILGAVNRYAPVDSPGKPIISPDFKRFLRRTSLVVAAAFILLALCLLKTSISLAIIAGLCLQTISLLPILNIRR